MIVVVDGVKTKSTPSLLDLARIGLTKIPEPDTWFDNALKNICNCKYKYSRYSTGSFYRYADEASTSPHMQSSLVPACVGMCTNLSKLGQSINLP